MVKRIIKIDNTLPSINEFKKTRVAAYARVSTDKDEQQNSLEAQKDYFSMLIKSNPTWELAGIYYDDGISGLTHKNRDGFNQMINDAIEGKIDFIITKSISRFARNTLDSLEILRDLKSRGIGVYFQKEDINTLDGKSEFVLTLMASFAQEESRSISENITWGKRKSYAKGKVSVPFSNFLGYKRGKNGELVIDKKEFRVIEYIFYMAILGYSPAQILKRLEENHVPSPRGGKKWHCCTIRNILSNEKYIGDALLQKYFTINYLTKEKKKNEGELPMYYVENNHEPIISRDVSDCIDNDYLKKIGIDSNRPWGLSEKIICGECGNRFGSFVIHPEWRGGKVAWRCRNKYSSTKKCDIRHIYHEKIYETLDKELIGLLEKRKDLKTTVLDMIGIQAETDSVTTKSTLCSHDDLDSVLKKITVFKNHDVVIEFINGITVNSHVDGTGMIRGEKLKIENLNFTIDFNNWLNDATEYSDRTKSVIRSGLRAANHIIKLSKDKSYWDNLINNPNFKNLKETKQDYIKFSVSVFFRYLRKK